MSDVALIVEKTANRLRQHRSDQVDLADNLMVVLRIREDNLTSQRSALPCSIAIIGSVIVRGPGRRDAGPVDSLGVLWHNVGPVYVFSSLPTVGLQTRARVNQEPRR